MSSLPYSDAEVETLRKGARGAALLVALSDRGFFDSFKEAGAMAKHLADARQKADSPLIRQLAEGAGTGFGLTDSPGAIETETIEALSDSRRILGEKDPAALQEYRRFVVELARSVSSAAGGGDEAEAATIRKIESALDEP